MKVGESFLRELGIKVSSNSITREALIRQLKTSSDTHIGEDKSVFIHSSLTIFSKELTVFLGYNNQQLMADLTDWFDCDDSWEYRTKHEGTDDISGVWVNLIGATTPELLASTLPRDAIGGGLTSRIIFVYESEKDHTELSPFLSPEEMEIGNKLLIDLEKISMMQGLFRTTPEFIEKWTTWYASTDSSPRPFDDHRFAGYFERRPTHMWKISMLLSASKSSSMLLDGRDFDRALSLLTATERGMAHTFSGMGKNKDADVLTRVMAIIGSRKTITKEDLQNMVYLDAPKSVLDGILSTLDLMGFIDRRIEGSTEVLIYKRDYKSA
ncbi:MAG: hypothetical protein WC208_15580 [Gallionella sp.]|jgi:hypothetical protein